MANRKVSELTEKAVPEGTDLIHVATPAGSRKSSLAQVFAALGGGGGGGGITDWNADPLVGAPAEATALGGSFDGTTLTVSGTPHTGTAPAGNDFSGALALTTGSVTFSDPTSVQFNQQMFNNGTTVGSDAIGMASGFVIGSGYTEADLFSAIVGTSIGQTYTNPNIDVLCFGANLHAPGFSANIQTDVIIAESGSSPTQFGFGPDTDNGTASETGMSTLFAVGVGAAVSSQGFSVAGNTDVSATLVNTLSQERALMDTHVGKTGTFFVAIFDLNAGGGMWNNVAGETGDFGFTVSEPMFVDAGDEGKNLPIGPGFGSLREYFGDLGGQPANSYGDFSAIQGLSPPALPADQILRATLTGGSYPAYGATIYDEGIYANPDQTLLTELSNDLVEAAVATLESSVQVTLSDEIDLEGINSQGGYTITSTINVVTLNDPGINPSHITLPAWELGKRVMIIHRGDNEAIGDIIQVRPSPGEAITDDTIGLPGTDGFVPLSYSHFHVYEGVTIGGENIWLLVDKTVDIGSLGTNDISNDSSLVAGLNATQAIDAAYSAALQSPENTFQTVEVSWSEQTYTPPAAGSFPSAVYMNLQNGSGFTDGISQGINGPAPMGFVPPSNSVWLFKGQFSAVNNDVYGDTAYHQVYEITCFCSRQENGAIDIYNFDGDGQVVEKGVSIAIPANKSWLPDLYDSNTNYNWRFGLPIGNTLDSVDSWQLSFTGTYYRLS